MGKMKGVILGAGIAVGGLFVVNKVMPHHVQSSVESVENADLTLDNNGILGYKVADFEDVVLGEAKREEKIIIRSQELSVQTHMKEAGLFGWEIFSKNQDVKYSDVGMYTVDLQDMSAEDISVDNLQKAVTLTVPQVVAEPTKIDPDKVTYGTTENGFLSIGELKLTIEEQNTIETKVTDLFDEELNKEENLEKAREDAEESLTDIFQPVISGVAEGYKVEIKFSD